MLHSTPHSTRLKKEIFICYVCPFYFLELVLYENFHCNHASLLFGSPIILRKKERDKGEDTIPRSPDSKKASMAEDLSINTFDYQVTLM
jgi:hypothetical protein